jgi:hypothetical protein
VSARAMLAALIDGEADARVLAEMAKGRMRRKIPERALRALPPGPGGCWPAGLALARPAPHGRRVGCADERHSGRADGPPGHSTVSAPMRYQHAASERDAEIARRMSERHAV